MSPTWRLMVLPWVLVWAVLWAQMAGLVHRIDHAAEANPEVALHSCVLFDGVCLADSLPTALAPPPALRQALSLPPATVFVSWSACFVGHFQSRAPPMVA